MEQLKASKYRITPIMVAVILVLALIVNFAEVSFIIAQTGTGVIRVTPTGNDTAGCGSEASPCRSIQFAVNQAASGDTIKLAQGAYTSTAAEVFRISNKTITIIGGYTTSDWNNSDPSANLTVVDGQNARRGAYIFEWQGSTVVKLQGITIQNGGYSAAQWIAGGGLYCEKGPNLSLIDVIFKNNTVQGTSGSINTVYGGGAAFFEQCTVSMQNVTFDGNKALGADGNPRGAQARGGGFFVSESTVTGSNITVTNNKAIAGSSTGSGRTSDLEVAQSFGGGFDVGSASTVNLTDIDVQYNLSEAGNGATYGGFGSGGGVFLEGYPGRPTYVTLTRGKINHNQAIGGDGSGIPNGAGSATGGGIMLSQTHATLREIEIIGNLAQGGLAALSGGGAMFFQTTRPFVGQNLILANNTTAPNGNVVEIGTNQSVDITFDYATIANNDATPVSGGEFIVIYGSGPANLTLNDSIIANQLGATGIKFASNSGHQATLNRSLWYNSTIPKSTGTGTFSENDPIPVGDPKFVDTGNGNFHILGNSAAFDKSSAATVSKDIDGQSRPYGSAFDVGADEYHPPLSDNSSKIAVPATIDPKNGPTHLITYNIALSNTGYETTTGSLEDTLPVSLTYQTGSLNCTGSCTYDEATRKITWSGTIPEGNEVSISYITVLNLPTDLTETMVITNTAVGLFTDSSGSTTYNLTGRVTINPVSVYLPIVLK